MVSDFDEMMARKKEERSRGRRRRRNLRILRPLLPLSRGRARSGIPRPMMIAVRILLLALVLAACTPPPQSREFPRITFAHLPQIALNVGSVEVRNGYLSPAAAPNVEHLFPVSPAAAALEWARSRFRAAGGSEEARITLRRASVVEVPLARTGGVAGLFRVEQSERYDAVLDVKMEMTPLE